MNKNNGKFIVCCYYDITGINFENKLDSDVYQETYIVEQELEQVNINPEFIIANLSRFVALTDIVVSEKNNIKYVLLPIDVSLVKILINRGYKVVVLIPDEDTFTENSKDKFGVTDHGNLETKLYRDYASAMLANLFISLSEVHYEDRNNLYINRGDGTFINAFRNGYFGLLEKSTYFKEDE